MPVLSRTISTPGHSHVRHPNSTKRETSLEVAALAGRPLGIALANDTLAKPLRCKAAVQRVQVSYNVLAALDDCVTGRDGAVGRDAQFEGSEERVRDFVCGEGDVGVLEEALGEEVCEGVVFLVEGEDGSVGDAWMGWMLACMRWTRWGRSIRVSSFCSTFFSLSSRRKSSNLS